MFAPGSASRRHEERAIGFVFFEMKLGYTLPADPVADFQPLIWYEGLEKNGKPTGPGRGIRRGIGTDGL